MRKYLLFSSLLLIPLFGFLFWHLAPPETIGSLKEEYQTLGQKVTEDFRLLPVQVLAEEGEGYHIKDTGKDGIDIQFANEEETLKSEDDSHSLVLSFPKDYSKPIEVKLDQERVIPITDLSGKSGYRVDTLTEESVENLATGEEQTFLKRLFPENQEVPPTYLRYQSDRKTLLYAYQKDQATGEKQLKHWTIYEEGSGLEQEEYHIDQAKVKINERGEAEVFYFGQKELQNEQVKAEVAPSLLERAQRTLAKEMGEDILNSGTPDFIIPKPYYIDREGEKHETEWKWGEESKTLSVSFNPASYPVALDPTLSFSAPGVSNGGSVITGDLTQDAYFGYALTAGDFNSDGRTDLAVGAYAYTSSTGRVYIFHNDGSISTSTATADVTITGEATSNAFGYALAAGDFNSDGRTDLAVGAYGYSTNTGRAYIFHNDGTIPTTAATADGIITGETTSNRFGDTLVAGDFDSTGTTDLAVGAYTYNSSRGRAYIFHNDGTIPTTAATADVIITGGALSNSFGISLTVGDFNADGRVDLAVGASQYSSSTGRAYIFHNDGSIPTTADTADVIITGEATSDRFGRTLVAGDFNSDGTTDLVVGAYSYSGFDGRVYIFHNDGSIPATAATADVIISGTSGAVTSFGDTLTAGDFNADGRTDLVIGATGTSNRGSAHIFYNDGSIPTTADTADVTIMAEASLDYFSVSLTAGDFNSDGRTDLAAGARGYDSNVGRAYIFYSQNGMMSTNQHITGDGSIEDFGTRIVSGDFNADGRMDLAVGAPDLLSVNAVYLFYNDGSYPATAATADVTITSDLSPDIGEVLAAGDFNADGRTDLAVSGSSSDGAVYLFYNDGSYPTTTSTADVTIAGEASSNFANTAIISGDLNADGRMDLIVSARTYSSNTGRVYIFHNDGSIPTTADTADVIITGNAAGDSFGEALAVGDFNSDGTTDLAVGAPTYSTSTGRTYLFYNDGSIPTTAGTANVTITGGSTSNRFGVALAAGDFNADGTTDLAIGAYQYASSFGRTYIFHNDGSWPTTAGTANVTITGAASSSRFGELLASGDFNADGTTDLVVVAGGTGIAYIFHNDGSIPTTAGTADVIITGDSGTAFPESFAVGDFNNDGRIDLAVGAGSYSSDTGRVYFYETRENFAWDLQEQSLGAIRTGINGTGQELTITGQTASDLFGVSLAAGDFNADGRTDLAVGAYGYATFTGRAYIFYGDGSLAAGATSADVIITGGASLDFFGAHLAAGDFNSDGRTDLAVGAWGYSSNTGRVYIFHNDGSIPTTAGTADVTITGGASSNYFGRSLISGDFNADSRIDLAIGASGYSSSTGRVYIFHNDGSIPTTAGTADVTITGGANSDLFSGSLTAGDFNADGRTDLAVGAYGYSTNTGRVYIFHNDGSIPTTAGTADVTITGDATDDNFGISLAAADFDTTGTTDFAVGAHGHSSSTGRVYIFHNDGSIPTTAGTADVTITGETTNNYFGIALVSGDFNVDGRADLVISASGYSSNTGRTYIFHNDGSIPTTAGTADVTITGETTSNSFGISPVAGDFNSDGKIDLAVSATGYSSSTGRVYIYTFNDTVTTGGATGDYFGIALATGDFNSDGTTDLAVGAYGYSSFTGRAYIFYNDGSMAAAVANADVTITGETTSDRFGGALASGDVNFDGTTDLVVGARGYSTNTGRVYIFHNDGSIPTTAGTADVTITGETTNNYFGINLIADDLNTDGRTDLAVGAYGYSSFTGRVYIFHNDGSIPTTAGTADVTITGETTNNYFGIELVSGDFNTDSRTDLVIGASGYSSNTGRVYIFHNDGSIPTTAGTADVTITGGATGNYFGGGLIAGDLNTDGKVDLAVGAYGYSTNTGRVYIFHNDGSIPTTAGTADVTITGETTNNYFGETLAIGDFSADGRTDLLVGASGYSTDTGRAYIFYNDGSIPTTAATADVTMTGETTSNFFGGILAAGDLNTDGKADIVISAYGYSSDTGRLYILISEAKALTNSSVKSRGTINTRGTIKVR